MLHEILPYVFDNSYKNAVPNENSYVIFYQGGSLLAKVKDGCIALPEYSLTGNKDGFAYLFSISGRGFFLADESADTSVLLSDGFSFLKKAELKTLLPKWLSFAAVTACQLGEWYADNRFCGHCGGKMLPSGQERMLMCGKCGNNVYPKISPAVIVGIINDDKILVSRYAANPNSKLYALIAGFTEIGEPAEETVRREVMEEVGLRVKNLRYYKSQPWAFTNTLLMGFFCDLDGSDEITLDSTELSEAKWVARDKLTVESNDISLTNEMMMAFKNGRV